MTPCVLLLRAGPDPAGANLHAVRAGPDDADAALHATSLSVK